MSSPSLTFLTVAALATGALGAQDHANPTLAPGDTAPSFTLKDSRGKSTTLAALLKKRRFAALVFLRSADW